MKGIKTMIDYIEAYADFKNKTTSQTLNSIFYQMLNHGNIVFKISYKDTNENVLYNVKIIDIDFAGYLYKIIIKNDIVTDIYNLIKKEKIVESY